MKYLVIFLVLIGILVPAFAFEPEPVGINIVEYGIFDPNDNNTNRLKVGEKYNIKITFESELDKSVHFTYFVKVIDKNKHGTEIVDEFSKSGTLDSGESQSMSFEWSPKYVGEFRTFSGVSTNLTNVGGNIPQFDFEVTLDNTKWHDYFPTYQIINLDKQYSPDQPFIPQILKKDLDGCNAYYAEIRKDKIRVWEYTYVSSCIMTDPPNEIESIIDVPKNKESITLSDPGEYLLKVRIGDYRLQEKFWVQENRVPEPESEKNFPIYENCPPGTTLQDGICVVDRSHTSSSDSTVKWGTGINFGSSWQSNQSNTVSIYDDFFSINEKQVRYNVFYNVTNASISNMQLDCDSSSFSFSIMPDDVGFLHLDIPKDMLGGIFMVQVNGQEWDDISLDGNVLTINFPSYDATVKVLGTYHLDGEGRHGVCDVIHDPPYSHILSPLKQIKSGVQFDEIQCKENFVVFQKYDGTPACVMESTKNKLIERGWTTKDSSNIPEFDYELGESEFLQIKNNMENIGYHICDIQHEENKILIVLNWIFEDSEPEKMILSQIPNNVSYEIKYLGGYADYFISKESVFSCEGSEDEN